MFSWSTSEYSASILASIMKNGNGILSEMRTQSKLGGEGAAESKTIIIHLEYGDRVWIQWIQRIGGSGPFLGALDMGLRIEMR